ncbi:MAG: hypothetical protein ACLP4V_15270, partial [Methylocella sp.]
MAQGQTKFATRFQWSFCRLGFLPAPKVTKSHRTAGRRRDKLPNPLFGGIFSLERRNVLRGCA